MKGTLLKSEQLSNPVLNVSNGLDWLVKWNFFAFAGEDGVDSVVVLGVELDLRHILKDTEQVSLDSVGVGGLTQNLEKSGIRNEEESWENETFSFKVTSERFLTAFKLLEKMRQKLAHEFVTDTTLDDIWFFCRSSHNLHPGLVNVGKALGGIGQLLGNVTADEDGFEVDPQVLDNEPLLDNLVRVGQL